MVADLLPALKDGGSHREHPLHGRPWFIGQVGVIGHGQRHPHHKENKNY